MAEAVRTSLEENHSLLRVVLSRPPGNIIDREMVAALRGAVQLAAGTPAVKTILIDSEGKHFSFGASVEEHRPALINAMLPAFHQLFREMISSGKVILGAIRGQCLGGGLELAIACHRIFAAPTAKLGNPEIKLGVFAPLASAVLPHRIGQARADDLLLTGRVVEAVEAHAIGLVDILAEDPAAAAIEYHQQYFAPLSAASLAHAVRAARHNFMNETTRALDAVERQYLAELMATSDAVEGIDAFLEKRPPAWKNL